MAAVLPLVGHVIEFDEAAGLGAVRADDGRQWSFHCTRIADGSRSIEVGTAVVFEVVPGLPGGWEASGLIKLA